MKWLDLTNDSVIDTTEQSVPCLRNKVNHPTHTYRKSLYIIRSTRH